MGEPSRQPPWRGFLFSISLLVLLGVLAAIGGLVVSSERAIEHELLARGRSLFGSIVLARKWSALHGGVFVEKTPGMVSNPYLVNPDRRGDDGTLYTKKNPALMTREISELAEREGAFKFHITSLRPINPENAPDPFERRSLEAFEKGADEATVEEPVGGIPSFRYMAPLRVDAACLACHSGQGYRVGDVRGGISVSFSMADAVAAIQRSRWRGGLLFLFTAGLLILLVWGLVTWLRGRVAGAEFALRASDERFRALIEHSSDLTMVVDEKGTFTFVSPAFQTITGVAPSEAVGRSAFEFNHPDDVRAAEEALSAAVRDPGSTQHARVRVRRTDGTWSFLSATFTNMLDVPAVRGIVVHNRDITDRAEAERVIRDREARLQAYFDSPAVGIAISSPNKGWLEANDCACSMLGYSREELFRLTWLELTHPDDVAADLREFEKVVAGGSDRYSLDKRFIRKDGSTLWTLLSVSCVRRADRSIDYFVAILEDITERKQAEQAWQESQRWLLQSQEIARLGSYVFDVPTDRWSSSVTLDGIFGIDAGYPRTGSGWLEIIHPDDREAMGRYLADLLAHGTRFDREYRIVNRASAETRWVHGLGELQRGPAGEPVQLVGTIQDVTGRKLQDIEREALQAKLALASRLAAMGTLVAGVAHEINNPLAATLAGQGVALEVARELLKQVEARASVDVEACRRQMGSIIEALEDASDGGQRVAAIVKDLAAFAKPDPKRTRLRLGDVAASALRWLPTALGRSVDIRVEDGDAPPVLASAGQIEQVVVNLLTNAAKATPPGKRGDVTVRIGPGGPGMARLEVVDRGTGIDPQLRARIFEPFFTTRPVGVGRGAGLGLAICHAIVTAHGGSLTVESEIGKGSTFRVELPAAPAEA